MNWAVNRSNVTVLVFEMEFTTNDPQNQHIFKKHIASLVDYLYEQDPKLFIYIIESSNLDDKKLRQHLR